MINMILLRGLVRETRHWYGFDKLLERKIPELKTFLIEMPGVGLKWRTPSPMSITQFIDSLRPELLSLKMKHDGPFFVVAMSMGGMIALDWASRFPDDFNGAIIINSSASDLLAPWQRMSPQTMLMISKLFFKNDLRQREREILKATTNKVQFEGEILDLWTKYEEEHPISRDTFLRQISSAALFKSPAQISIPLCFIASKADKLANYQNSEMFAKKYQANLYLHQDAGHDLSLDDPEWLADKTAEWIANQKNC